MGQRVGNALERGPLLRATGQALPQQGLENWVEPLRWGEGLLLDPYQADDVGMAQPSPGSGSSQHLPQQHPKCIHIYSRSYVGMQHDLRGHVGDGPVHISRQSGRGIGFPGQPKVANLGLETVGIDGGGCEHDIAT